MQPPRPWTAHLLCLAALACFSIPGCGPGSEQDRRVPMDHGADEALPSASAEDYLRQVLARYRNAKSYRDEGEVVLRVEKDGRRIRQIAPMHVALDANKVWIAAYDARLWSDASRTLGWIANEKSDFHDSQVVVGGTKNSQPAVARPSLEFLLSDPILSERMVAGLGGPPPQLEWLLDPDPMARLFGDRSQTDEAGNAEARKSKTDRNHTSSERSIEYQGVVERDGRPRVIVRAIAEGDEYLFWIDKATSVIHSVDLPVSMTGRQVELDGWTVHSLELRLMNARFGTPPKKMALSEMKYATLPTRPRYVSALVPLPPPAPSARLGGKLGTFRAIDPFQNVTVTDRGAGRAFTVFFAGHLEDNQSTEFQNYQAAANLVTWFNQLGTDAQQQIQIVTLSGEQSEKMFADTGVFVLRDDDSKLRDRIGISSGQIGIASASGRLIWIGNPANDSDTAIYSSVIVDSANGIDVPAQMRKQSKLERAAYREKVSDVSVSLK